ncbi:type II secretion system protein F [Hylemonella gracilis str. Niagara R]|uniref:Type II secretion system protein F n=1 Tax=Hylemonella gracilis str. Niagara R TaxID=1458275 RepID=A0A016XFT2_9BURK|nr:type II secretion system F family protein [Hylemonella gracilis]EYC50427.1 type II secretion system protein F [Hylemonella gracilis str. Niagara R]
MSKAAPPRNAPRALTPVLYIWTGEDASGRMVHGELRAASTQAVRVALRDQDILPIRIQRRWWNPPSRRITAKDIALFTRQFAAMVKAGVPLLRGFDIVAQGRAHASLTALLRQVRVDVEAGATLSAAFGRHPRHFDRLYCSLVEAGETAGMLDQMLERLALHLERTLALHSKIRAALMYPAVVVGTALLVVLLIMAFVIPAFRDVFHSFGAELPHATLLLMAMSDFLARWWAALLGVLSAGAYLLRRALGRNAALRALRDRAVLTLPLVGPLLDKSCLARWTRTLATLHGAGVPMAQALTAVRGAADNQVYEAATDRIRQEITLGTSLAVAMERSGAFAPMVLQMCAIGEESGAIDAMLAKAADFHEAEVSDLVTGLSGLLEPLIILLLGLVIGGIVVALYLPIFQLGQIV